MLPNHYNNRHEIGRRACFVPNQKGARTMVFFDKLKNKAQSAAVNVMDAVDAAADKIGDTAENLEEKFEVAVDKLEDKLEVAGDKIEAAMDAAGEKLEEVKDAANEKVEDLMDKVESGLKGEASLTDASDEEIDDPSIACIK